MLLYPCIAEQPGAVPSIAELEAAGVQHVVAAEAQGSLQECHPYIYAAAEDLRVADVELLLSAYKQLVYSHQPFHISLPSAIAG